MSVPSAEDIAETEEAAQWAAEHSAVDPAFITATPADDEIQLLPRLRSQTQEHHEALGEVTRLLGQPPDERLANLERFARCVKVIFRRQAPSQEEIDLQLLMPDSLARSAGMWEYTCCAICLTDFADGEELRRAPCPGGHAFHPKCLRGWLERSHATCPTCRGVAERPAQRDGANGRYKDKPSPEVLAEFVTRRMRSRKVDHTVSKDNHQLVDLVMGQLRGPTVETVVEPREEPDPAPRSPPEPSISAPEVVEIVAARMEARKAELALLAATAQQPPRFLQRGSGLQRTGGGWRKGAG